MVETAAIIAIIIGCLIVIAVTPRRPHWDNEAEIKRLIEEAKRHHGPRKSLYRRLVNLRCEQLKQECE